MSQLQLQAWGRRDVRGNWRGGILLPGRARVEIEVPRAVALAAAQLMREFLGSGVSGEEVGFLQSLVPIAGQLLGAAAPSLIQGGLQALGGLLGGGQRPQPAPPPPAPAPAPAPPPPAQAPALPAMPGLAQALGAGVPAADLLGSAQVLAAVPSMAPLTPELRRVLTTAVRIVDAEAARRIGDPRARRALEEARRVAEERVIRALRLVDAMLS